MKTTYREIRSAIDHFSTLIRNIDKNEAKRPFCKLLWLKFNLCQYREVKEQLYIQQFTPDEFCITGKLLKNKRFTKFNLN